MARNDDEWIRYWASPHGAADAGFVDPGLPVGAATPVPSLTVSERVPSQVDAVVIGAGAGGGVMALRLAEAGLSVLVVERGELLSDHEIGRDHLRNQRVAWRGHSAGPFDGHPRVAVAPDGGATEVAPWDVRYHANAATVGGGTRVFGAQAWRFHPLDFAMASTYGVPPGSSLADWPIDYTALAAHYARVEHELGVAGDATAMTHLPGMGPHGYRYPMPAVAAATRTAHLQRGADALGWPTMAPPLAINTVARDGRGACTACPYCVGFACAADAKNGTHNTYLPRAVATGRAHVLTGAMATRVEIHHDAPSPRARAVSLVHRGAEHRVECAVVALCAGAIETARLLLLSGCNHAALGRHLQGHVYVAAFGTMAEPVWDGVGPGPSVATGRWQHGNDGIVGGGTLLDDFVMLPVAFWMAFAGRPRPADDDGVRAWMRHHYTHTLDVKGPIQDIPSPEARVTLDPHVRDRYGLPVARLSGTTHPESIVAAAFLRGRAEEWLRASGATDVWGAAPGAPYLSGGQHQAGTCRMGDDPETSVVDRDGRLHGVANVLVGDTSVHVTNGGVNPFLTAMALADRTATRWLAQA